MPTLQDFLRQRLALLTLPVLTFGAVVAVLTATNGSPTSQGPTGNAVQAAGDTETAIASLRAAVQTAPADAHAYALLGDAYYARSRESGDPADVRRAERTYDAALRGDPDDVTAVAGLATVALSRHDFTGGLDLARRAHRLEPALLAPYPALVDGLIETGRYGEAARTLDQMVRRKPSLAAYTRISYFRELNGDPAGAAEALRLGVSAGAGTAEGNAFVRSALGDLEADRGRYGAAERAYREALAVDPEFGSARTGLAHLQAGRGDLGAAVAKLRGLVGDPPSPDALAELGEVEQAAGLHRAARRHYATAGELERALLADGSHVDAGVTLFEAEHGRAARAVRLGRRAWRAAPSVSAADAYSWALQRAGRSRAAARLSTEAMKLGSRDPEFIYHAGLIARSNGRLGKARRLLGGLLEQTPRFSPLQAPRARAALRGLG
ncbi:MAG: tetratricopeptide repeat protein [Solirubrobacterales bacterium]